MAGEILFKAKRIDKHEGEWVEGYVSRPHERDDADNIVSYYFNAIDEMGWNYECIVSADTICRYTGFTCKSKKVWENDIVKYHFGDDVAVIKFGKYQNCFDSQKTCHVGFYVDWEKGYMRKDLGYWIEMIDALFVGNAIDNPELLL